MLHKSFSSKLLRAASGKDLLNLRWPWAARVGGMEVGGALAWLHGPINPFSASLHVCGVDRTRLGVTHINSVAASGNRDTL